MDRRCFTYKYHLCNRIEQAVTVNIVTKGLVLLLTITNSGLFDCRDAMLLNYFGFPSVCSTQPARGAVRPGPALSSQPKYGSRSTKLSKLMRWREVWEKCGTCEIIFVLNPRPVQRATGAKQI